MWKTTRPPRIFQLSRVAKLFLRLQLLPFVMMWTGEQALAQVSVQPGPLCDMSTIQFTVPRPTGATDASFFSLGVIKDTNPDFSTLTFPGQAQVFGWPPGGAAAVITAETTFVASPVNVTVKEQDSLGNSSSVSLVVVPNVVTSVSVQPNTFTALPLPQPPPPAPPATGTVGFLCPARGVASVSSSSSLASVMPTTITFNGNQTAMFNVFAGVFPPPPAPQDPVNVTISAQGFHPGTATATVTVLAPARKPVIKFIDPVPTLVQDGKVIPDTGLLLTQGRVVTGVAADGVTQVVVRITGAPPNDTLMLSLDQDGELADVQSPNFQPTVSVQADSSGTAFALYRAPLDFVRAGNTTDLTAASRTVTLSVQSSINAAINTNTAISILRPPVVLVHGLWDGPGGWSNFFPLIADAFGRFQIYSVSYNHPVHILSSTPSYASSILANARTNALGFDFNWSDVQGQIESFLSDSFKNGQNPLSISVAAVQADIVAHSMGGDIIRYMRVKSGTYVGDDNFDQGPIHKLITIGTPHQGTPLASQLLDSANSCVQGLFASHKLVAFSTVAIAGQTFNGAVLDLTPLSSAIASLGSSFAPPIRTALVGGAMTPAELSGIGCIFCVAALIRQICGGGRHPAPFAVSFTVSAFPGLVGGDSDGIVPLASALDLFSPASTYVKVVPAVHSSGAITLDFGPPSLLDGVLSTPPGNLPNQVITLLNAPTTSNAFASLP